MQLNLAERMGFEPMKELPLYTLSKRAPSTTRPPLHHCYILMIIIVLTLKTKCLQSKIILKNEIFVIRYKITKTI
jgi:hypothetical protein